MDSWERDQLQSINDGLRNQVEHIMDAFEEQKSLLAGVHEQLAAVRVKARSADSLVEVTVDHAGIVTQVEFLPGALRSDPEKLGRAVTQATREAARAAHDRAAEIVAPITEIADGLPDLPDLVPGAPSLRELRDSITESLDAEEEDR